jgi:DNA-binding MurR/RpiR family transcriptional regulator
MAQIPFETAESVALATGTSGITVGRFCKLGYRNLEDAKKVCAIRISPGE